jgi:hypothetical protein
LCIGASPSKGWRPVGFGRERFCGIQPSRGSDFVADRWRATQRRSLCSGLLATSVRRPDADAFWRDFNAYTARAVHFVREPNEASYGTVAVFEDLYGNLWDLLQKRVEARASADIINV